MEAEIHQNQTKKSWIKNQSTLKCFSLEAVPSCSNSKRSFDSIARSTFLKHIVFSHNLTRVIRRQKRWWESESWMKLSKSFFFFWLFCAKCLKFQISLRAKTKISIKGKKSHNVYHPFLSSPLFSIYFYFVFFFLFWCLLFLFKRIFIHFKPQGVFFHNISKDFTFTSYLILEKTWLKSHIFRKFPFESLLFFLDRKSVV